MKYLYKCSEGDEFEIEAPIQEGPPAEVYCKEGHIGKRIFSVGGIHYHTDGFHSTDYNKTGDKLEQLNKSWSKHYGEKPPPKSKEVPRSRGELW